MVLDDGSSVQKLKGWLVFRDIKVVLWDLDDTILDTVRVFVDQTKLYTDYVCSQLPELSKKKVHQAFVEANDEAYHALSVSPKRWELVIETVADRLSLDREILFGGLPIILRVYETAPEFLDGAEEALRAFRKTDLPMGVVTHASEEWTQKKFAKRGLDAYFDQTMTVSEEKFKSSDDWLEAIRRFGVGPEDVLVLGDNLSGDIRAVHSIGVRHIVYFPSEWSIYSSGEIPEGVISVDGGVKDLVKTLISMSVEE